MPIPQVALDWLLRRPSVSSVPIDARDERQLRDSLGALGWSLMPAQTMRLDAVRELPPPYPVAVPDARRGAAALRGACRVERPMAHRKPHLPTKTCACCHRPFAWRRKWARDWEQVRFCSDRCRAAGARDVPQS